MIIIKSPREIEAMRRAGAIVGQFFEEVKLLIRPGRATFDLEEFAEDFVGHREVKGAFKGYLGYPANLCTSINEEVVHGIPSRSRLLREGDILSIDFGVVKEGYYGDAAKTFAVGNPPESSLDLMRATEAALEKAIEASKKSLQREPKYQFPYIHMTVSYIRLGREEEARAAAAELLKVNPKFSLERYAKMLPFTKPVADRVIEDLRKAGLK